MTQEECERRNPRVMAILKWHGILTASEAACTLRDYRLGTTYGCEAVSHSGRTVQQFVHDALQNRKRIWSILQTVFQKP